MYSRLGVAEPVWMRLAHFGCGRGGKACMSTEECTYSGRGTCEEVEEIEEFFDGHFDGEKAEHETCSDL